MRLTSTKLVLLLFLFALLASGCPPPQNGGEGEGEGEEIDFSCLLEDPVCAEGLVCEAVFEGDPLLGSCVSPLTIVGEVFDFETGDGIEGALVQAVDVNGAPVGTTETTDADGGYILTVPAERDADGVPIVGTGYTVRVQAAGYEEFPTPIRRALPLDASEAVESDGTLVIEDARTSIALIPLPGGTEGLGSISGNIQAEDNTGILIIAEGGGQTFTGFSDSEGNYTIFNVPAGTYTVQGYRAGVQLDPADSVVVEEEEVLVDVDLTESEDPLSTVSGSVNIVNAPGGSVTSVILAVESTFDALTVRGTAPPGLRAGDITGAFVIEDVPDGRYVVLAAFENDDLVRDPDPGIAGTQIVMIDVPDPVSGNDVVLPDSFKITEALEVIFPGAEDPEEITEFPLIFEWADDSSEDNYDIVVNDSFGTEIWNFRRDRVTGSETVTQEYLGPELELGTFYQFRVTSLKDDQGTLNPISTTEDLKGVFFLPPPPEPEGEGEADGGGEGEGEGEVTEGA